MATPSFLQAALRSSLGGASAVLRDRLGRFRDDPSGNMSYVAIAGSLVMMVFGGVGVDMMHAELKRNKVQNTLDRAVLAAANLDNELDATFVVEDYFRAMDMSDTLTSVDVQSSLVSKQVTAVGRTSIASDFMSLIGVDTLESAGRARAENAGAKMEISLVLDVSGSMSGAKIEQLRVAAKSFIDQVLGDGGEDSSVTISIIPYNATVNLGPVLSSYYTLEDLHDYSTCAHFPGAAFDQTAVDPAAELGRISHFDPYGGSGTALSRPWCATGMTSAIVPHSSDPEELKAHIDTFTAGGNTAIDLGVKWGLALLDPSARPVMQAMHMDGLAGAVAAQRPVAFDVHDTMKFVVVMTDGQNTSQYDLTDSWKGGMSDVWIDDGGTPAPDDDRYSVEAQDGTFYWPHLPDGEDPYRSGPYSRLLDGPATLVDGVVDDAGLGSLLSGLGLTLGNLVAYDSEPGPWNDAICGDDSDDYSGGPCTAGIPRRLSNAELMGRVKTRKVGRDWYREMYQDGRISYQDYRNAYNSREVKVNGTGADTRLSRICAAGRDNGVVIYAIGVEAPTRGLRAMGDCASSPAHFFDVDGDQLEDTFASIATTITQLRLTQ